MTNTMPERPIPVSAMRRRRREAEGFTLLEVLVAMLVLAVGALGIAAMQLRGLQYNHDAYLRSQISVLAYDIADRMRLNQASAASYASTYNIGVAGPACTENSAAIANDLACWQRRVWEALPPGGSANIVDDGGGEFTVTMSWVDREGTTRTVNYTFQP